MDAFPGRVGRLALDRVVAIGDGFLAGATDGALFRSAQERSLPALFARAAGRAEPAQPLIADPGLALEGEGGRLRLVQAFPPVIERIPQEGAPLDPDHPTPYDNLAVPGALLVEVLVAESGTTSITANPFYDLVLRGRGPAPEQAAELGATLVLLWLGTHDVLDFALAGADPAAAPGLPTGVGTFTAVYRTLLDQILATAEQAVLFNVPDVTKLPAFTSVPPIVIDPATGDTVTVTVIEQVIDPVTGDTTTVQRQEPVPLIGPDGRLDDDDLVTLDARPLLAQGVGIPVLHGGTGAPLPDRVVLDVDEQVTVRATVEGYNAAIAQLAAERDLPVVDVRSLVDRLAGPGVVSDGVLLTADFVTGQAFGLDGVHFTVKGTGLVVNLLIDAVNERYGSRLPHIRTADLPGVPLLGGGS